MSKIKSSKYQIKSLLGAIFFTFATLCGLFPCLLLVLYILGIDLDNRPLCSSLSFNEIAPIPNSFQSALFQGIAIFLVLGEISSLIIAIVHIDQSSNYTNEYALRQTFVAIVLPSLCLIWIAHLYWEVGTSVTLNCGREYNFDSVFPIHLISNSLVFFVIPTGFLGVCAWVFWAEIFNLYQWND